MPIVQSNILSIILDPKDIFIIEDDPYESYDNNANQDESLELVTDVLQETRKYLTTNLLCHTKLVLFFY